jgi:hypothetical protein
MTAEAHRVAGTVLVTTPTVPHLPTARVVESGLAWSTVMPSVPDAIVYLQRWAVENRWDAIVDLRIQAITNSMNDAFGKIHFKDSFVVYGTAIRYGDM